MNNNEAFKVLTSEFTASKDRMIRCLADRVIFNSEFYTWSGSSKPDQHHYGKHGLLIHTAEVIQLCKLVADMYGIEGQERQNLMFAALFHDIGKTYDYKPTNEEKTEWTSSDHKYLVHHISRSGIIWVEAARNNSYGQKDTDEVLHAILSHHGLREWGSPVQPKTKIAWALHLCDNLSARLGDCELKDIHSYVKT
jgi:23S rRNA maturation-related 3'-5' exoribonuclease YhaM